jgi:hypothetical protein
VRREERRAASAESLRRALDASGVAVREAGALIGVDEKLVRRWLDPHEGQSVSVADLAALPIEVRIAVVRADLLPGHVIVRETSPSDAGAASIAAHVAAQRETSEALTAHLEAIADGHITRAEGASLERELDEAIARLVALREHARQAQREGVIGVDGVARLRVVGGAS